MLGENELWWDRLHTEFRDAVLELNGIEFEPSPQEAPERVRRRIRSHGHPSLLPYRHTDDREAIREYLAAARAVIPQLERLFGARDTTPEFFQRWGAFQFAYGIVTSIWLVGREDQRQIQAGRTKKGNPDKKAWYSKQLLTLMDGGMSVGSARRTIEASIKNWLKQTKALSNADRDWLTGFMAKDGRLSSTYRRLSKVEAQKAVRSFRAPVPEFVVTSPE